MRKQFFICGRRGMCHVHILGSMQAITAANMFFDPSGADRDILRNWYDVSSQVERRTNQATDQIRELEYSYLWYMMMSFQTIFRK